MDFHVRKGAKMLWTVGNAIQSQDPNQTGAPAYGVFKAVVGALLEKPQVFYSEQVVTQQEQGISTWTFQLIAIDEDNKNVVFWQFSTSAADPKPSTLLTDFPNAIQLATLSSVAT